MTFEDIKLYDILRLDLHLPDNRAMEAMVAMDEFFSQKVVNANRDLPTKAEVATKAELESTKNELKADISAINLRLDHMTETMATKAEVNARFDHMTELMTTKMATKAELSQVNLNLTGEIYKVETKLTRTIFSASLAQLLVILISIFTILKYAGVIK